MTNTILLKRSSTASAVPAVGNLTVGELALNYTDGNLFFRTGAGTVALLASTKIVSVTGNIDGGNVLTGGLISATGTITSAVTITGGNLATGGTASATGNVTGGNVLTGGLISATGNIDGGNLRTGGLISATGNITSNTFLTGGLISATGTITGGNITGANILTAGLVSATGNVTGNILKAAGLSLSGTVLSDLIPISNVTQSLGNTTNRWKDLWLSGNTIILGESTLSSTGTDFSVAGNVTGSGLTTTGVVTATGNVTGGNILTGGLISAAATITGGNIATGGTASATGNITGGNIATGGTASATGNITGGNVLTGGLISATGAITSAATITGGNIATGGTASATGNITGGNVLTGGLISATGNVTGGNINTNNLVSASTLNIVAGTINLNPTGNVGVNSRWINNLADPVADQDAATKIYVDTVAQGLDPKASVAYATATTLDAYTYNNGTAGVGATITATANGALSIDGFTPTAADRVLIKNETGGNAPYNGIYVVTTVGSVGTAFVLTRATDFNQSAEIPGAFTFVEAGTVNADSGYVCTTNAPVVVGTTNIVFTQFSGAGSYSAGDGISFTGTVINAIYDNSTIGLNGSNQLIVKASASLTTPNIGAATGTSLSTTGTITGGNLAAGSGTISTSGNVTGGNILTGGLISATGNVAGNYFIGNGSALTGLIASVSNISSGTSNVTVVSSGGNVTVGVGGTGNVVVFATTGEYVTGLLSVTGNVTTGNVLTGGLISATGNITGGNITIAGSANISTFIGNVFFGSVPAQPTWYTIAPLNLNNSLAAATKVQLNLINTGGGANAGSAIDFYTYQISVAAANAEARIAAIDDGNYSAWISLQTKTPGSTGTNGLVERVKIDSTGASVVGNVTGGNLRTGGLISATATVTGGNLATGGTTSATGNITGGNVLTGGLISATGNIAGNYFIGNGSALTGISGGGGGSNISNGTSNVSVYSSGNVAVGINGSSNVGVFSSGSLFINGLFTSPKTITGNVLMAPNSSSLVISPLLVADGYGITVPSDSTLYVWVPS